MTDNIHHIGKMMLVLGVVLVSAGGLLMLGSRISWFGRLPGDILIQKKNVTFYIPLATSILVSILLTLIVWLVGRR